MIRPRLIDPLTADLHPLRTGPYSVYLFDDGSTLVDEGFGNVSTAVVAARRHARASSVEAFVRDEASLRVVAHAI